MKNITFLLGFLFLAQFTFAEEKEKSLKDMTWLDLCKKVNELEEKIKELEENIAKKTDTIQRLSHNLSEANAKNRELKKLCKNYEKEIEKFKPKDKGDEQRAKIIQKTNNKTIKQKQINSPIFLPITKNGIARFQFDFCNIYLLQSNTPKNNVVFSYVEQRYDSFVRVSYKENGVTQNPVANYLKIKNIPQKVEFVSDNEKVLSIKKSEITGETIYTFISPGLANITVSISDRQTKIPIQVHGLPLHKNMTGEEIIKEIGIPDRKKSVYIRWYEPETVDNIFYYPKSGNPIIREHWFYNKYPELVLSLSMNSQHLIEAKSHCISNIHEDTLELLNWLR